MSTNATQVRVLIERAANGQPVGLRQGRSGRGIATSRTPHAGAGPFRVTLHSAGWVAVEWKEFQATEVEAAVAYAIAWIRDGARP